MLLVLLVIIMNLTIIDPGTAGAAEERGGGAPRPRLLALRRGGYLYNCL